MFGGSYRTLKEDGHLGNETGSGGGRLIFFLVNYSPDIFPVEISGYYMIQ